MYFHRRRKGSCVISLTSVNVPPRLIIIHTGLVVMAHTQHTHTYMYTATCDTIYDIQS